MAATTSTPSFTTTDRLLVLPGLTRREREVAHLLAAGYTNREIAAALVITEGSAHVQVGRLLNKLGFHTRSRVAAWAVSHGVRIEFEAADDDD